VLRERPDGHPPDAEGKEEDKEEGEEKPEEAQEGKSRSDKDLFHTYVITQN
jgi:hypothetical protein